MYLVPIQHLFNKKSGTQLSYSSSPLSLSLFSLSLFLSISCSAHGKDGRWAWAVGEDGGAVVDAQSGMHSAAAGRRSAPRSGREQRLRGTRRQRLHGTQRRRRRTPPPAAAFATGRDGARDEGGG
uniref:Uncharacterized protein n=1 Tax=Oryza sativa subsp. japonica TaxID=39947 RepID=Q6K2M4_ORYSJ|nr:hypothetical protein [Oryza sativa Japonica Group]